MISIDKRIQAFAQLGKILLKIGNNDFKKDHEPETLYNLDKIVTDASHYNGWFIDENVRYMLTSIGDSLAISNIEKWIKPYRESIENSTQRKVIGVVMAGNVPLVGFHDFLSVLISGNKILAKLSTDDNKLLPAIAELLIDIEPDFKDYISFTEHQLKDFDAIIATGSNNTSRYFEYYFGSYPNIIRKNRNGVAILTGDETEDDLSNLTKDIFMYYGLGCRNVSHIMIPEEYDLTKFLDACAANDKVNLNHKYFNNYEYNKAIYLVNGKQHFDSGNLLLTEDDNYSSPVSVLHFSRYSDTNLANRLININNSNIQCVVTISNDINNAIKPGISQSPQLWDYADGIDTMNFLSKKLGNK